MNLQRSLMAVFLLVCATVLLDSSTVFAQSSASLHVVASSTTGAPVAGARAALKNEQSGNVHNSVTGSDGSFDFTGLAARG